MSTPRLIDDPLYQLLREGQTEVFNLRHQAGDQCDLRGTDLRGLDLRGLDAAGLDLSNCYMRQADLRGVDFSDTRMEGVSISGAKISGAYFPTELAAQEISLSLLHGTRMRYCTKK